MTHRLPPLSTLPVLEAAARLGSFSAAAEELHVTHGAVSHQMRSLEKNLGVLLFVRNGRRIALTADGAALAVQVRAALKMVGDAVQSISPEVRKNRLAISVLPSFASRWLMPHIGSLGLILKRPRQKIIFWCVCRSTPHRQESLPFVTG